MSLDEYEREYRAHVQAVEEAIRRSGASAGSDERRAAVTSAERAVEAARDVVQLMELEGRSLAGAQRTKLQTQLRSWRDEVSGLKARCKELRASVRSTPTQDRIREECFAGGSPYRDDSNERSRMLASNERMSQGTDRLKQTHAVTLEMEDTANAILGDLSKQRETLLHAKGTMRFAMDGLDQSGRVLSQMARRAAMNRLTLYVVIALLLGMLLCLWLYSGSGGGDAVATQTSMAAAAAGGGGGGGGGWHKRP